MLEDGGRSKEVSVSEVGAVDEKKKFVWKRREILKLRDLREPVRCFVIERVVNE